MNANPRNRVNLDCVMDCAYKGSRDRPPEPKKTEQWQKSKKLKNLTSNRGSKGSTYSQEKKNSGTGCFVMEQPTH